MKKFILLFIVFSSLSLASSLEDYVAKFDKPLAIQMYVRSLESPVDHDLIYSKLAGLFQETGQIGLAKDAYRHLLNFSSATEENYKDFANFLFEIAQYKELRHTLPEKYYDKDWGTELIAKSYFYETKFDSTLLFTEKLDSELGRKIADLSCEGLNLKPRSPFLAGSMSAIIPGSGKMYAGRFWDGLQAFSMVVAPAYNAYYQFRTKGTKSFEAWLWTGIASWFYLSDIYGSIKATIEYNEMQRFKITEKLVK